ncbi:hypothetical protein SEA_KRADAL_105 [Streptomyces phage Kradal]|nr:hypothetical protein SEA_KRADAL_105 [Streptomyces phage Kradal]QPL14423.1 hypothetical protein SEA_EHYELIMAYOE_106 [Streptomyces phage EhyElimayoE]
MLLGKNRTNMDTVGRQFRPSPRTGLNRYRTGHRQESWPLRLTRPRPQCQSHA